MGLEWIDPALDALGGIRDYIAKDSHFYARRFIEWIFAPVESLMDRDEDRIQILSVMHGSRYLGSREKKPWEVG